MTVRGYVVGGLVSVVALAGAFVVGRYSKPVEVRTEVVERTVTVERRTVVEKRVEVAKRDRRSKTTTTTKPDGSSTTVTESHEREDTRTETARDTTAETATETERHAKEETRVSEPDWRVGGMVGLSGVGTVYGGSIERRILGPVWLGAWGLSSGAFGVSVGVEF